MRNRSRAKIHEFARFKISNWVEWVGVSPDRPHVFYTNPGGGRVYDLEKKEELPMRFVGQRASLSKNGRRLLSGDGGTLYLWDVDSAKEISNVDHPGMIRSLALAGDGRHAIAGIGKIVHQWDMEEKKQGKRLEGPAMVVAVALSPDGKRALTGGVDKKMRLWDLSTGAEIYCFEGHTKPITTVAFAPNGRQALSGSDDKTIRLWQLPTDVKAVKGVPRVLQPLATSEQHSDAVSHLAVSRDGTKVVSYSADKLLRFWELDAGTFKPGWKQEMPRVQGLALDPSGKKALLAIGGNSKLSLVDTETQKVKDSPGIYSAKVVEFSTDGRRYLVGDRAGGFALFSWPGGGSLRSFSGRDHPIRQLCFSGDGERILSSGDDHSVRLWNSTNADELKKLSAFAAAKKRFIALSPDGKQALISQDSDVHIWDLSTGKSIGELKGHKDHVTAVAYGPDGAWAVSASQDMTLRVWDLATQKVLARLEGHSDDVTCIAVAAQGRLIISGSRDQTLRAWKWMD